MGIFNDPEDPFAISPDISTIKFKGMELDIMITNFSIEHRAAPPGILGGAVPHPSCSINGIVLEMRVDDKKDVLEEFFSGRAPDDPFKECRLPE
jgi:hypothetical protein